jgi:hypothetical protein
MLLMDCLERRLKARTRTWYRYRHHHDSLLPLFQLSQENATNAFAKPESLFGSVSPYQSRPPYAGTATPPTSTEALFLFRPRIGLRSICSLLKYSSHFLGSRTISSP